MKKLSLFLLIICLTQSIRTKASDIVRIKSFDEHIIIGKLDLPEKSESISALVIFIPGTGPNTYDNHRLINGKEFTYYDLFAEEFNKIGVGFFRYNTRGVYVSKKPPMYDSVNAEEFKKSLPSNHIRDVECLISEFRKDIRFKSSKIILLGWSEGTIIASMVAQRKNVNVDAIILAGYANEKVDDIMRWQLSGQSSMVQLNFYFDYDGDGRISREEFEKGSTKIRKILFNNVSFNDIDTNKDNFFTLEDLKERFEYNKKLVFDAIEKGNDEWLQKYYARITSAWVKEHSRLMPNKETLLEVNIPIFVLHGENDWNAPVEGVRDLEKRFLLNKKDNLNVFIYKKCDHDLNYSDYIKKGTIPEGISRIFSIVDEINKNK